MSITTDSKETQIKHIVFNRENVERYCSSFQSITARLIKEKSSQLEITGSKINYVDIVRDVINLIPVYWIAEEIVSLPSCHVTFWLSDVHLDFSWLEKWCKLFGGLSRPRGLQVICERGGVSCGLSSSAPKPNWTSRYLGGSIDPCNNWRLRIDSVRAYKLVRKAVVESLDEDSGWVSPKCWIRSRVADHILWKVVDISLSAQRPGDNPPETLLFD